MTGAASHDANMQITPRQIGSKWLNHFIYPNTGSIA